MIVKIRLTLLLVFIALFQVRGQNNRQNINTLPKNIDAYIENVLKKFEVPGVSISVVKNGKTLLAKGYGVKELGKKDLVDEHTLFCIASNSKAFTATLLAILVEERKIGWKDLVVDHLPWFKMADPYVTNHLTVEDLLVHRSGLGLGAGDLLQFPPTTYTAKEIVERLRYLPLATSFRDSYAYDNALYVVAGELIKEVTGKSWEQNIEDKIFKKIGMNQSITRISDLMKQRNIAYPHTRVDGVVVKGENFPDIRMGDVSNAAGGISSNAVDMAKWLKLQLDSGKYDNGKLFKPATAKRLWTIVTPMPIPRPTALLAPLNFSYLGYALGFRVHDFRNHQLVTHTGGLSGAYYSRVTLVPELGLGISVLTNQESRDTFEAITNHLLDYFMGYNSFDWLDAHWKTEKRREARMAAIDRKSSAQRDSLSKPSLQLKDYVGTYRDAWYGDVTVALKNGELTIVFDQTPSFVGTLQHWQHNTFVARWNNRSLKSDAFMTFVIGPEGKIEEVRMKAASPTVNFSRDFHDLKLFPLKAKK